MSDRLSLANLHRVDAAIRPAVDPRGLEVGIVHLGLGAFVRAHGLVFTERAMALSGETAWGYCGVTQRSRSVLEQLGPQDGLYTVLVRDGDEARPQVVGTARDLLFAGGDPAALAARLADARVRLVTLTVTEKGYRHDPSTRGLRRDDPDVVADVAGRDPVTVVGQLVRGLRARRSADVGPISLLSCDNLSGNGAVLRRVVLDYCALLDDPGLADWIDANVAFPSSMVDRIVPATTAADRAETLELLGLVDEGIVATEPFAQWVIEDSFAAGRPAWQLAGATMTDHVEPYERMKLRLLNGSHSTMAYLGMLAGHDYIADAVRDPDIAGVVERLMVDDMTPTLEVPSGFDLPAYREQLVARFNNTALRHRLTQVAMDGSQKIPIRMLEPIRERLASGASPVAATLCVAAWMHCMAGGPAADGSAISVDDPLADRMRLAASGPDGPLAGMLGVSEVFGDLADDAEFRGLVGGHFDTLTRYGAKAAASAVGSPS